MESSWFRNGLDLRQVSTEVGDKEMSPVDTNVVSGPPESNNPIGTKLEFTKPNNLNAFDIISLSTGFDCLVCSWQMIKSRKCNLHPKILLLSYQNL